MAEMIESGMPYADRIRNKRSLDTECLYMTTYLGDLKIIIVRGELL